MKKLLFFLVFGTFIMQSCHKDKDTTPDPSVPVAQKKLTILKYLYSDQSTDTENFTYDDQGRVIRYDDGYDLSVVTYSGNQVGVTETRTAENNRTVFQFTGNLDNQGRLVSGEATSNYVVNNTQQRFMTWEYDANGYLKQATMSVSDGNNYKYTYTYKNGNLSKMDYFDNGAIVYSELFEYGSGNTDRTVFAPNTFMPVSLPFGKRGTELWTKYTQMRDGAIHRTGTATYTKDTEGYVTQGNYSYSNGNQYQIQFIFN